MSSARAEPPEAGADAPPPLRVGGETRHIGKETPGAAQGAEPPKSAPKATAAPKPKSHKSGPKPKTPEPTLPEAVPLGEPSAAARSAIAEGPTAAALAKGASSAELDALDEADRVLFPESVPGLTAGWSFELPRGGEARPTLGLPLGLPRPGPDAALGAEDAAWLRSLTLPDLPVRLDQRVVTYLKFYRDSPRGRTIAAIWAKKSGRYIAAMKAELRRAGLPTDLVWLSMIESGHDPIIRSPAGAVGLWQFMPESARMYGLTVDAWVDERRDPARSTQAAVRFLSDLHQRFGNWELAMGAYNMGYAGMSRAIAKYNTNDFWALSRLESGIPWETTLYVPKIFALAVVMNNREAFGLGRIKADPAVVFDTILVEPATSLGAISKAANVPESEIRDANPRYLAGRVPPVPAPDGARYPVSVPRGTGHKALLALRGQRSGAERTVEVRFGDTAQGIAFDYGIQASALLAENGLAEGARLSSGMRLILPKAAVPSGKKSAPGHVVVSHRVVPGPGQKLVFYQVLPDDDLDELALAFGVPTSELVRHNALDPRARLRSGMTLQVVVPNETKLDGVRHFPASEALAVLVAGSPEFHEFHEALGGKRRLEVLVRSGDTLASLGARYGMTVGSMERVNRRARTAALVPGERLVVYTDRARGDGSTELSPGSLEAVVAPRPDLLPGAEKSAASSARDHSE